MGIDQARLLARLGRSGTLPWWLRPVLHQLSGLRQVVTTPGAVEALLAAPAVSVPYGPRSEELGLDAFPLALDGDAHREASDLVAASLAATARAHRAGVTAAAQVTRRRLRDATSRIDVVGGLVDPALGAWVEEWYGLSGQATDLRRTGRLILHATFLNPTVPSHPVDETALRRAVTWLERCRPGLAAAVGAAPEGTLAADLLARTGEPDLTVDLLLGLTVGPLALGSWALAHVVDELLATSWVLDSIDSDVAAREVYAEALARRPPLPGVLRDVRGRTVLRVDGRDLAVPRGRVLAATACARFSPEDRPGRAAGLVFGAGSHACLGRAQVTEVSGVVLEALGRRSPRRVPGPAGRLTPGAGPTGVAHWPFPGRLQVSLLR